MRLGGFLVGPIAALLFVCIGCGPPVEIKQPDLPEDAMGEEDKNVNVKKAKEHIEKAVAALRDSKLKLAREELDKAEPFADELKREEIRRVRQSVDEEKAKGSIPKINDYATQGKCEVAVKKVNKVMDKNKGTAVGTFVKKGTSKKILACLLDQLAVDLSIARELAERQDVKRSLTKLDHQTLVTKVTDSTVKELIGKFSEPLENKEWGKAKALLDELIERKEAGDNEYNRIMGLIREGIGKEIKEKVDDGLDNKSEGHQSSQRRGRAHRDRGMGQQEGELGRRRKDAGRYQVHADEPGVVVGLLEAELFLCVATVELDLWPCRAEAGAQPVQGQEDQDHQARQEGVANRRVERMGAGLEEGSRVAERSRGSREARDGLDQVER